VEYLYHSENTRIRLEKFTPSSNYIKKLTITQDQ
jgi:hypothetical protein